ncbi:hypothetical protein CERZMDRAFT_97314 [Cercospora zeae-maydis SCOH1-5]|uniref:SnoaL-like domain-containing protein n=1 Tax=Cercospora zeae-maydis SCOH1-5 TaxID=717836 RepID=A0A6A6FHC5_9PEZI|nr:hypothetical protein CERZMDRAFT_97314 [Cercospora zeae-maydis SCOH1-5]
MMNSKYEVLPFLPETKLEQVAPGITLLNPLSRRGYGPGLIVLVAETGVQGSSLRIEHGVPSPVMKWGEEGYSVVEITEAALTSSPRSVIESALEALKKSPKTEPKDAVGVIAYSSSIWNTAAEHFDSFPSIVGAVIYGDASDAGKLAPSPLSQLHHLAGKSTEHVSSRSKTLRAYDYPAAKSYLFATPFDDDFIYHAESVSHTRNLSFLKPLMKGPYFDLEAIWDEHTYYEFENRSVECTMNTMVQEPYVNHIPTLTGGIGRQQLSAFYRDHFIFQNPDDVDQEVISRSIGIDRVIDEFLFKCTHNKTIDWLVPGIPPTGRWLEIPLVGIVNIRGDRLYHEHISWDQSTVLAQLGLLPEYLPFPYASEGVAASAGKRLEFRVPATGADTARKLRHKDHCQSNEMLKFKVREI